jgi:hypothetical protein
MKQALLRKTNRLVTIIPWVASTPKPWGDKHERVHVPFSETEMKFSRGKKKANEMIVRRDSLDMDV